MKTFSLRYYHQRLHLVLPVQNETQMVLKSLSRSFAVSSSEFSIGIGKDVVAAKSSGETAEAAEQSRDKSPVTDFDEVFTSICFSSSDEVHERSFENYTLMSIDDCHNLKISKVDTYSFLTTKLFELQSVFRVQRFHFF